MTRAQALQAAAGAETEEEDLWSTGTGMADDFDGIMTNCFFGTDEKYNNGQTVLFVADLVDPLTGEPTTTIKYSVGEDWEPDNDGTLITHPTKAKINSSSRFGRFIDRIVGPTDARSPKNNDVIAPKGETGNGLGLADTLRKRGKSPTIAACFEGLNFHWKQHEMGTMGADDQGKQVRKQVLLPTAFNGVAAGTTAATAPKPTTNGARPAAAARATAPVATAPAASTEPSADLSDNIPPVLYAKLTSQAKSAPVKDFVRSAAKNAEVAALPDDVMAYVLSSGDGGFWAAAQK